MKRIAVGDSFGRLVVTCDDGVRNRSGSRLLLCECQCGKSSRHRAAELRNGKVRSCGCLQEEVRKCGFNASHRDTYSLEYNTWSSMISRCENPKHNRWQHYGGRGITICERWRNSYEAFLADMGRRPSPECSIDRVDVNGNYEPSNCRWAAPLEQAHNKQASVRDMRAG